jgi:hypothetical protein
MESQAQTELTAQAAHLGKQEQVENQEQAVKMVQVAQMEAQAHLVWMALQANLVQAEHQD